MSSLARVMRLPIQKAIGENQDDGLHRRLTGLLVNYLNQNTATILRERNLLNTDIANLVGFDLNKNSPLTKYCNLPLTFEETERNTVKIAMRTTDVASCITFFVNSKKLNSEFSCTRTSFELQSEVCIARYLLSSL